MFFPFSPMPHFLNNLLVKSSIWPPSSEERLASRAEAAAQVIAAASSEVRSSILYATILIVLVFVPLLGLAGLEGRLFRPIAIATIVSMVASFVVSLTVIPVLCSFLLKPKEGREHRDGSLVRALKAFTKATFLERRSGRRSSSSAW